MGDAPDIAHETRAHSALGASVAHRWMACPGSIRLTAGIENPTSVFMAEGTAAHELCEMSLRADFKEPALFIGDEIVVGNHKFEVDEEMAEAVQVYVDVIKADYCRADGDILLIEHRFDLNHVWKGMFGTGDAGIYNAKTKTLRVIDYKHGKGHAVEVENNPQLAYYGLGMINVPSLKGIAIAQVELVIVQPRAPHRDGPVRRWVTDPVSLMDFEADLRSAAQATEDPNAPLFAGEHCKFCPAAGICPALRDVAITQAQEEFVDVIAPDLTGEDLARLADKMDLIEDGIRAIRSEMFTRAQGGAKIPGWKLVPKRAVRKWAGEPDIVKGRLAFQFELSPDQIVEEKLRSPAQIEKLLPKHERDALKALVVAESSGVTLARETDRRAEAAPKRSAQDDFGPA
jgi:hypothetical protein